MSASRVSRFTRCKLLYAGFPFLTALVAMFTLGPAAYAQDRPNYIVGEPQGLEMLVHIVGETAQHAGHSGSAARLGLSAGACPESGNAHADGTVHTH